MYFCNGITQRSYRNLFCNECLTKILLAIMSNEKAVNKNEKAMPEKIEGQRDVFISYKRKNASFATRLYDEIEKHGISVWVDLNKQYKEVGEEYQEKTLRVIIQARSQRPNNSRSNLFMILKSAKNLYVAMEQIISTLREFFNSLLSPYTKHNSYCYAVNGPVGCISIRKRLI